jgi:hypothetical protein
MSAPSAITQHDTTPSGVSGQDATSTGEREIKHWRTYTSGPLEFQGKSLGSYRSGTLCADEPDANKLAYSKEQWLMMHNQAGGDGNDQRKTTMLVCPGIVTTKDNGHALSVDYKIYGPEPDRFDGPLQVVSDALKASKGATDCHGIGSLGSELQSRLKRLHTGSEYLSKVYDAQDNDDHQDFADARFSWGS